MLVVPPPSTGVSSVAIVNDVVDAIDWLAIAPASTLLGLSTIDWAMSVI